MEKAIFKQGVEERLAGSDFVRIELGCGPRRRFADAVTIDRVDFDGVDIVADLDQGLPLEDASVDELHSRHFLEHVADLGGMMDEIHRVLKPGGKTVHTVPHFSNPYFYSDYTHKTFFGLYSFHYFSSSPKPFKRGVPSFYNDLDFEVTAVRMHFRSPFRWRQVVCKGVEFLANLGPWAQEFHEENLCGFFSVYELKVELVKPGESDRQENKAEI